MQKTRLSLAALLLFTCQVANSGAPPTVPQSSARKTFYLGTYVNGHQVGYVVYSFGPDVLKGKAVFKGSALTVTTMESFEGRASETFYVDPSGKPIEATQEGNGEKAVAVFGPDKVVLTDDDHGKVKKTERMLPTDGVVCVDTTFYSQLDFSGKNPGDIKKLYMFSWGDATFVPFTLTFKGKTQVSVKSQPKSLNWIKFHMTPEKSDKFSDAMNQAGNFYVSDSWEPVQTELIHMLLTVQEDKQTALTGGGEKVSMETLFRLSAEQPVPMAQYFTNMTLKIAADKSLPALPSDDHQTETKTADGCQVEIHPTRLDPMAGIPISFAASHTDTEWTKPDSRILSNSPPIVALAKKIVGRETDVLAATLKIQHYVAKYMKYDVKAIGSRTSDEIYKSRHGVCVDYAILTGALLRAAGIPTQLACGMVSPEDEFGSFYSHEWVKVFIGTCWVGIETTAQDFPSIGSNYLELAAGSSNQLQKAESLQEHHAVLKILTAN